MTQKIREKNGTSLAKARKSPYRSSGLDNKKIFIKTADECTKDCLLDEGFHYFTQAGKDYFFLYDELLAAKVSHFAHWEDIEFTDVLTFPASNSVKG